MIQPTAACLRRNIIRSSRHCSRRALPITPRPRARPTRQPTPPCAPVARRSRQSQMEATGGDELEAVKNYFNTSGFERWNKIYGETDEVRRGLRIDG
jgi:hypothetical protein